MKHSPCASLCAVALSGVWVSCSPPPADFSAVTESAPRAGSHSALSDQVFSLVNSYRASKGKPALWRHPGLDRLAQQHCDHLAKTAGGRGKTVSHAGFDGRVLVAQRAYRITSLAENVVASTEKSAGHLVKVWVGSKGHERNMRGDWACTGIAAAETPDGQVIVTQLFGTSPDTSPRTMAGRSGMPW